jgi:protein phosphatase
MDTNEPEMPDTAQHPTPGAGPSRFYEFEPRVRAHLELAGKTHRGLVRPNNEDNFLAVKRYRGRRETSNDYAFTLAVADGMGGRNFGELASLIAIRTGFELDRGEIKWAMKINEREAEELRQKAGLFFHILDEAIHKEMRETPSLQGMGTTLTVCYTVGNELFIMHAGDSRAYLQRGSEFRMLTHDHTLAQILIDSGIAEPDSIDAQRVRHILTNVLGGPSEGVAVDVRHHRLETGDRLLLCTDGLTDLVTDDEIRSVLNDRLGCDEACEALIQLALDRGGTDNVTVLVARYEFTELPIEEKLFPEVISRRTP